MVPPKVAASNTKADCRLNGVLVVGASGRVGQMLARAWDAMGLRPTLQHRGPQMQHRLPQLQWSPLVEPLGQTETFSAMIVLAGTVPGKGDLSANSAIATACLCAARAAQIETVLIASSSAVYGANDGTPFLETDVTAPINDYGRAKLAMEAACDPWRDQGLKVCALRIGNVAGADALLLNAGSGRPVLVDQFADRTGPVRSYIGPLSLARALAELTTQSLPAVLNVAAADPVAMADLAQCSGADWAWRAAPATAQQRITLNCQRLAQHVDMAAMAVSAAEMVVEWQSVRGRQ